MENKYKLVRTAEPFCNGCIFYCRNIGCTAPDGLESCTKDEPNGISYIYKEVEQEIKQYLCIVDSRAEQNTVYAYKDVINVYSIDGAYNWVTDDLEMLKALIARAKITWPDTSYKIYEIKEVIEIDNTLNTHKVNDITTISPTYTLTGVNVEGDEVFSASALRPEQVINLMNNSKHLRFTLDREEV